MSDQLLRLALAHIADSDPGKTSEQSLAHEMAAVAKQALAAPTGLKEGRAELLAKALEALEPFAKAAERAARGELDLREIAWPLVGEFDADSILRAAATYEALRSSAEMLGVSG